MINIQIINIISTTIIFVIAYLIVVSLTGFFRSWVALKMGDTTPRDLGFLTLNPATHIDLLGIFCLLFFHFGWGKHVHINYYNITGKWQFIKRACAFFSDTCANIAIAFVSLIGLLLILDKKIILLIPQISLNKAVISYFTITHLYPTIGSLTVAITVILLALIYLNIVLGVLNLIINGWHLYLFARAARAPYGAPHMSDFTRIVVPIFLVIFFSGFLQIAIANFITCCAYLLAYVLHIF